MDQTVERVVGERIAIPPWAWLMIIAAAFAIYLVSFDNGAVLKSVAGTAHEFFHDGRHALGVPCH